MLYSSPHSFSVIQTEHFDFIYPPESEDSARFLAQYADGMYDRLCDLFNFSLQERFPVAFTPDTEALNAFFTTGMHNHIVMFDTIPDDSEILFEDHLLTVFYHELTHAFTAACRSRGWDIAASIFGDILSPGMTLRFPLLFIEGFAVAFESGNGQGRVNDPLIRQVLSQAKLNGSFPHWSDVAGYADTIESGSLAYYFGGLFCDYLRSTYGQDALSSFIVQGNYLFKGGRLSRRFKKAFGVAIDDAWQDFERSIVVPQIAVWPEAEYDHIERYVSSICATDSGSLSDNSIFSGVVFHDAATSSVYALSNGAADFDSAEKIFTATTFQMKLSLSPDGRYLLVSEIAPTSTGGKNRVLLYDMERRSFTGWEQIHCRDASFVRLNDGSLAVCAVRTVQQQQTIEVFTGDNFSVETVAAELPKGEIAINLCSGRNGMVAYLAARGLYRRITEMSVDPSADDFGAASPVVSDTPILPCIRYLSSFRDDGGDVCYAFSWAERDSFYRFAVLNSNDRTLNAQTVDISGGIHYPAVYGKSLYFASKDMTFSHLATAPIDTMPCFGRIPQEQILQLAAFDYGTPLKSIIPTSDIDTSEKRYNPLPSLFDGLFLPYPALPVVSRSDSIAPGMCLIGVDSTQRWSLDFMGEFNLSYPFLDYSVSLGNSSLPLGITLAATDTLKYSTSSKLAHRYSDYRMILDWTTYVGQRNLNLSGSTDLGTEIRFLDFAPPDSNYNVYSAGTDRTKSSLFVSQSFTIGDSWRKGCLPLDVGYWNSSITGGAFRFFDNQLAAFAQLTGTYRLPGILTGVNKYPITWTLPLTLGVFSAWSAGCDDIFSYTGSSGFAHERSGCIDPVYDALAGDIVAGGKTQLTLFSVEMQQPVPFMQLHFNRFRIEAEYGWCGFWNYDDMRHYQYADYAACSAVFDLTPFLGNLSSFHLSVDARFEYGIHSGNFQIYICGRGVY